MALLHGGARDYALDGRADLPREPILCVVASSDAAFIAVLTPIKLYIWSDKVRACLQRMRCSFAS